jgi:hypothetical protein
MRKKKKISNLTLIWYRNGTGEARTCVLSSKVLIWCAGTVLLGAALLIFSAISFYLKSSRLTAELRNLENKNLPISKPLIREAFPPSVNRAEPAAPKDIRASAEKKANQGDATKKIAMENVAIDSQPDGKGMNLRFEIVSRDQTGDKFSGYVIIVGKTDDGVFTVPEGIELKDGRPVTYSRGDKYSIKYRKQFQNAISSKTKWIEAFIYSEDGRLLIRQDIKAQ